VIVIAALGGLLAGTLIAVAWTAGYRQGRGDVLSITRALNGQPAVRYWPAGTVEDAGHEVVDVSVPYSSRPS
jgi:hypothetical protein